MQDFANVLDPKLESKDNPARKVPQREADKLRSKREYEIHMSWRQRAEKESDPEAKKVSYEEALKAGNLSAEFARKAKDPAGEAYAYMSMAGAVYPALGRENEGLRIL